MTGHYTHNIDTKGRLFIPAKLREELGATFHVTNNPPKVEGVCDHCGAELTIRKDDAPETVLNRLKTYHETTEPLKGFYEKRGKLKLIESQPTIEATTALICKKLEI